MIVPSIPTLGSIAEANAAVRPDNLALVADERTVNFAALAERGRAIAGGLAALGMQRQDRVAILAQNCAEFCEVYVACELSGFIAVPLNYRLTEREIARVLEDSGARVLIFETAYAQIVESLRGHLEEPAACVAIGNPRPDWAIPFAGLDAPFDGRFADDDIAFLIYTSGTTGRPKGCMIGQHPEAEKARITAADTRMCAADRILLTMPLFHIGAKAMLNAIHWAGGTAYLHREFRPEALLGAVERHRITMLHLAPTMVAALLDHPAVDRHDLSSLRAVVYSASAMPLPVLRRGIALLGPIFYQIYGLTEGIGTVLTPEHHVTDGTDQELQRLRSVGVPSPGVQLRIGDELGETLPKGEPGEIMLRTPAAALGYWNDSNTTVAAFRDGWLRTGDIGYRDTDGFIYLVDRKKDMIVSGGENIYSREVEDALYQHPAVQEAAVIGVPDDKWGEAVCAVVVVRPQMAAPTPEILIAHVRSLIASYKKPREIHFIDALPKTANGKVDKQAIRAAYAKGAIGSSGIASS